MAKNILDLSHNRKRNRIDPVVDDLGKQTKMSDPKITTCNICLTDKEDKDMVRKLPISDCKCTFRRCIDCALQCDFYLCQNAECPRVHDSCPQCKLGVEWSACANQHVLSDAKRLGFLFRKTRELYEKSEERYDNVAGLCKYTEEMCDHMKCEIIKRGDEIEELKRLNARLIERLKE